MALSRDARRENRIFFDTSMKNLQRKAFGLRVTLYPQHFLERGSALKSLAKTLIPALR